MEKTSFDKHVINLIKEAVMLVGDGGIDPFTEKERILMNDFLYRLEKDYV